jgi:peptidyl-tRNA hydrolase
MKLISAFVLTTMLSITAGIVINNDAAGTQAKTTATVTDTSRSMFAYHMTVEDLNEAWADCSWTALDCR